MRWLATWLYGRLAGRLLAPELEKIFDARVCHECGTWRCIECGFLIITWWDHRPACTVGARQKESET